MSAVSMIAKIQALIDRAMHPSTPVEEARSSAMIAVKLITEAAILELAFRATDPIPPPPRAERTAPAPARPRNAYDKVRGSRYSTTDIGARSVRLAAKYDGFCKRCRGPFTAGDLVWWLKGHGTSHFLCGRLEDVR